MKEKGVVMKKADAIKICVGLATYNEEKNILNLLKAIDKQKLGENIQLKKIIISDDSNDLTFSLIKNYKSRFQVDLYHHNYRRGKMRALQEIVQKSDEEIIVLMDGDIIPKDENTISKLIQPFLKEKNKMGIAAGNPLPYSSIGFRGGIFSAKMTEQIKENIRNGCNFYSVNGRILAISRKVLLEILKPQYSNLIIDDGFIYFQCKRLGKNVKFVKDAVVYYKPPKTLTDFTLQRKRFEEGIEQLKEIFGEKYVENEIHIPYKILMKAILTNIPREPAGFINWAIWFIYTKTIKRKTKWRYVSTTK